MVKFLLIRFSSIGDIVLTTPVIRCLKTQVEDAEIHYLTKRNFQTVLENNPYIDKLWLLDDDLNSVLSEIKDSQIDYIIDLHHNLRTLRVKKELKLAAFSFNKINLEKWLIVNFNINRLPEKHIVDRYMETIRVFDVENDQKGLDYFVSESDRDIPANINQYNDRGFIALVIGARHFTKKMPVEKLGGLCSLIRKPLVILGGPGDKEEGDRIVEICGNKQIINACGKLGLNQSAEMVRRSTGVISHDTGLMHIAAAFKKPVASIWGNTIPGFGMYPYLPGEGSEIFEVNGLKCRPCSKIGFRECPKRHFKCMMEQNIQSIAEWANNLSETTVQ